MVNGGNSLPYEIIESYDNIQIRKFSSVDSPEFHWHRDKDNRHITILDLSGTWEFQFDNQLPFKLYPTCEFFIIAKRYHKLIVTSTSPSDFLLVKIKST